MDLGHSIVRLRGSIPMAFGYFGLALAGFRNIEFALVFHAGLMTGYVAYEFIHLAAHARWRGPGLAFLNRYHQIHHHVDWYTAYGVTTPLWDWVFGTLPRSGDPSGKTT